MPQAQDWVRTGEDGALLHLTSATSNPVVLQLLFIQLATDKCHVAICIEKIMITPVVIGILMHAIQYQEMRIEVPS